MSLDLHDLAQRVMNAETPADGAEILREAIEQLIGNNRPEIEEFIANPNYSDMLNRYNSAYSDGYRESFCQYQSNLLASIKPKGDK